MSTLLEAEELIGEIRALLATHAAAVLRVDAELGRLSELGICTGTAFYRTDTRHPALYANHGTGVSCPLHGSGGARRRIRAYVGTDELKQRGTLMHMANAKAAVSLKRKIDELQRGLVLAGHHLAMARDYLRLRA